jgi:hypothetical protein
VKTHKTIRITRRDIRRWGACLSGVADVAALLPARLSTNPEHNLRLALKLADQANKYDDRPYWLVRQYFTSDDALPDTPLLVGSIYDTQFDAYIIAQWLAWIADKLLTEQGK